MALSAAAFTLGRAASAQSAPDAPATDEQSSDGTAPPQNAPEEVSAPAETASGPPSHAPTHDPSLDLQRRRAVRVHLALMGHGGFGAFGRFGSSGSTIGGGVGTGIDVGAQFGDHFAFYVQTRIATLLFINYFQVGLAAEWTPVDFFSIGGGLAFVATVTASQAIEFATPILFAFNLGRPRRGVSRSLFRIAIEGSIGLGLLGNVGGYGGLSFGWVLI